MRYEDLEIESILKLARAAREMERNATSAVFDSGHVFAQLAETFGQQRGFALLDAILSHEDRIADFGEHWRSWRKRSVKTRRRRT